MGLGKPRSLLGKFIDKIGLKQRDLEEAANLSRNEVIKLCDGKTYRNPYPETKQKVISALRRKGHDVRADDFWE